MIKNTSYRIYATVNMDCNTKYKDGKKRFYYGLETTLESNQGFNGEIFYEDLEKYTYKFLSTKMYKSLDKTCTRKYETTVTVTRRHDIVVTI